MQILSISLQNIKSHRDTELHFVKGINVLSGENGVGKSTIFEAIGYAMFGVDARDFVGNIERFITIGAKKGEISVTFATDDGENYRVSRGVGAGSKWLLARKIADGFEVEDHSGAAETEARIKELLKLKSGRALAEQYKLVIGPFQNEFLGPFVLRQPTKRQDAFDEILGIDAWRKTYSSTRTLLSTVRNRIEVLAVEIKGRQEQVDTLPEKKKELAALLREVAEWGKELAGKEKGLAGLEKTLAGLDEHEKKITSLKADCRVRENRIRDGEAKLAEQAKRVKESEQAICAQEKNKPGKEAYEAAEAALKTLREKEKRKREIEKDLNGLDREAARLAQSLAHETEETCKTGERLAVEEARLLKEHRELGGDRDPARIAARLAEARKEAEKLRSAGGLLEGRRAGLLEGREKLAEGACPFFKEQCLNVAGKAPRDVFSTGIDELAREREALDKKLAEAGKEVAAAEKAAREMEAIKVRGEGIEKQLTNLAKEKVDNGTRRKSLAAIAREKEEAEKKAAARKEDLEPYKAINAEISKVEKQRDGNQAARDAFFANQKDARDLENRQRTMKDWAGLLEKIKAELAGKQQELAGLEKDYDPKRHAEVRVEKDRLVAGIATIRQKISGLDRDRLRLAGEIEKLNGIKAEIAAKAAEKKSCEAKEELVRFLRDRIFNSVSAQLSERFREEISFRADRIYRNIAETDEELYWGDKYRIVLRDMVAGELRERSDDQLSGGQTMSAVVALRLALLQTIGSRVAFFDEPTSNLDAARRENLAQAFRAIDVGREEVTEHWYDQLFLISHDVAFAEVTDQIISLE
ncbi:MAG: SMC family ATPase [Desulfurivibrionaceae bacterium]|nr:SMC family ATPase [Desulfurivibrionaceae bacterium]